MPSEAAGGCVIAKLFRLVAAELLERTVDEARLENVLGRRRDRQIAELHVEVGGEFFDRRIEPAVHAPDVLAVEIAHHRREERQVELAQPDRKSTRLNSSHVKISYAVF